MTHSALDVLAEVRSAGGFVKMIAPDRLRVVAPAARLPDLVQRVREVKPALLNVLATSVGEETAPNAREWKRRFHESIKFWGTGYPLDEAKALAWGEMEHLWHKRHGELVPAGLCAGCRNPIGNGLALVLSDSNVVHLEALDCVIAYGERWRGAATGALRTMGLVPPTEDK